jgi:hypothetical protein
MIVKVAVSELTKYEVQHHAPKLDRSYHALGKKPFASVCRTDARGSLHFSRKKLMVGAHTTKLHLVILIKRLCNGEMRTPVQVIVELILEWVSTARGNNRKTAYIFYSL